MKIRIKEWFCNLAFFTYEKEYESKLDENGKYELKNDSGDLFGLGEDVLEYIEPHEHQIKPQEVKVEPMVNCKTEKKKRRFKESVAF